LYKIVAPQPGHPCGRVSLSKLFRHSLCAVLITLLAELAPAQNQSSVALDTSETLFTVLTALNTCGYDQELGVSDPLRSQVRSQVASALDNSPEAKSATQTMCQFYEQHKQPDI